jgi:hypothetical protein
MNFENVAGGNVIVKNLSSHYFKASSHFAGRIGRMYPHFAKLNGSKCWSPSSHRSNQWLQVDLGGIRKVEGFETQGSSYGGKSWCTKIRFDTSNDEKSWTHLGVFNGNTSPNDIKNNKLTEPTSARYVRFYPIEWKNSRPKLRVEIFWSGSSKMIETKTTGETRKMGTPPPPPPLAMKGRTKEKVKIPEPPGIVVNLSTELVQLRGGPYWSESYALLRPTLLATSKDGMLYLRLLKKDMTSIDVSSMGNGKKPAVAMKVDEKVDEKVSKSSIEDEVTLKVQKTKSTNKEKIQKPIKCLVDHLTDSGGWILIASMQSNGLNATPTNHELPTRTVGSAVNRVVHLQQLGDIMNVRFNDLATMYNQETVIDEVRVFGCSLLNQRIIHYKTDNINICKRVEHDVYGLCKDVAIGKDSCLPNNADYTPLSGHHRFGAGKTKRICCKSNKKDIQIGLVWVN